MRKLLDSKWQMKLFSFVLKPLFVLLTPRFSSVLCLSSVDRTVLETSCLSWKLNSLHKSIKMASSHEDVRNSVDEMWQYCSILRLQGLVEFFSNTEWYTSLERSVVYPYPFPISSNIAFAGHFKNTQLYTSRMLFFYTSICFHYFLWHQIKIDVSSWITFILMTIYVWQWVKNGSW